MSHSLLLSNYMPCKWLEGMPSRVFLGHCGCFLIKATLQQLQNMKFQTITRHHQSETKLRYLAFDMTTHECQFRGITICTCSRNKMFWISKNMWLAKLKNGSKAWANYSENIKEKDNPMPSSFFLSTFTIQTETF